MIILILMSTSPYPLSYTITYLAIGSLYEDLVLHFLLKKSSSCCSSLQKKKKRTWTLFVSQNKKRIYFCSSLDLEGTEEFQWSSAIRVDRIEERPVHMLDGTWSTSMDLGNSCQNRFTIICWLVSQMWGWKHSEGWRPLFKSPCRSWMWSLMMLCPSSESLPAQLYRSTRRRVLSAEDIRDEFPVIGRGSVEGDGEMAVILLGWLPVVDGSTKAISWCWWNGIHPGCEIRCCGMCTHARCIPGTPQGAEE